MSEHDPLLICWNGGKGLICRSLNIVLADDHLPFRKNLKKILAGRDDLRVVGEAGDGMELLSLLEVSGLDPHLVLLDISMPKIHGIDAAREIKTKHPGIRVLILSMHKDTGFLQQAISAGAEGYLLKEDANAELFSAIETVRQGRTYISPSFGGMEMKSTSTH